jgi:mannitol/fructose-specific phosphotransferase system IIA component (Ntr-type)
MRLSELLNSQAVTTRLRARTKREAIAELVELLEAAHSIDSHGEILLRVMHREEGQTTGIGNGVAIPHGKARAVSRMVAASGVSEAGVDFESVDGEPVTLFKEESVRQSLREADGPEAFLAALRAAEAVHIP